MTAIALVFGGLIAILLVQHLLYGKKPKPRDPPPPEWDRLEARPHHRSRPSSPKQTPPIDEEEEPSIPPIRGPIDNPFTFDIRYRDAYNRNTHRRINIENADALGYITAWCYGRDARRTFRADRIREMVDPRTGEVIPTPLAHIHTIFETEFAPGTDFKSVLQRATPGLKALIWIARGDNMISPRETEILLDYMAARSRLRKPASYVPQWNPRLAARAIHDAKPTLEDASDGIRAILGKTAEEALLRSYVQKIVMASGEIETNAARRHRSAGLGPFEPDDSINIGKIE